MSSRQKNTRSRKTKKQNKPKRKNRSKFNGFGTRRPLAISDLRDQLPYDSAAMRTETSFINTYRIDGGSLGYSVNGKQTITSRAQYVDDTNMTGAIRISGCALVTSVNMPTAAENGNLFVHPGASADVVTSCVCLNPYFDPRIALFARAYTKYAFRFIRLRYLTSITTSTSGDFVMAIDTNVPKMTTDMDLITATPQNKWRYVFHKPTSVVSAFRFALDSPAYQYNGRETWYTDLYDPRYDGEAGYPARYQQTTQVNLVGTTVSTATNRTPMGNVYAEYVIDMYDPQYEAYVNSDYLRLRSSKVEIGPTPVSGESQPVQVTGVAGNPVLVRGSESDGTLATKTSWDNPTYVKGYGNAGAVEVDQVTVSRPSGLRK